MGDEGFSFPVGAKKLRLQGVAKRVKARRWNLQLMQRFINCSAWNGQPDLRRNGKENFIGIRRNCAKVSATPEQVNQTYRSCSSKQGHNGQGKNHLKNHSTSD